MTSACSSARYYAQSVSGQIELILKQQPVTRVIADKNTDPVTREKLTAIEGILRFAHTELGLPDNGSYRNYVDLKRAYVVWNVFAAPELSLEPKQWCYPVAGCVNYRGYFHRPAALEYAHSLQSQGWEIYTGGVAAYSTLGWFRDPLTNSMINREIWEIARIIFHELAHQRLYLKDSPDLNEAFADAVAIIGLEKWLESQSPLLRKSVNLSVEREQEFISLVLNARRRLHSLYTSPQTVEAKREGKSRIIGELREDYLQSRKKWGNDPAYDNWVYGEINNAKLSALSTYRSLLPCLLAVYESTGSNLTRFYAYIEVKTPCGSP